MASWDGASILVIRLSSLGDVARLFPSLRSLRGAGLRSLDLTVEDRFAPLLDLFPLADRVLVYPRRVPGPPWRHPVAWTSAMRGYFKSLRRGRYDLAIDLHGILRSALVARMSGARETAGFGRGFGKEQSHRLYGIPVVPASSARISRYRRYAGALEALGFDTPAEGYFIPRTPPEAEAEVQRFLSGNGLAEGRYLFAFTGTSLAQAHKRWPLARFVELARLARERWGLPTVLGWGPEERELIRDLPAEKGLLPIPDWKLPMLLEAVRMAGAFVGADTGAMHLAALMGVPTVAVLGPTDPILNEPYGKKARTVHRAGIRRACSGENCRHGDCMAEIYAEFVADAVGDLLAGR